MTFDSLLERAKKYPYGILNEFEITPSDLFQIVTELDAPEMREHRAEFKNRFKVYSDDNSANIFDFFAVKRNFVDKWFKREYVVEYEGVPLRLVEEDRTSL